MLHGSCSLPGFPILIRDNNQHLYNAFILGSMNFLPPQEACVQVFIATEIEHKQHHIWGNMRIEVEDVKEIKNNDVNKAKGQQTPLRSQIHFYACR